MDKAEESIKAYHGYHYIKFPEPDESFLDKMFNESIHSCVMLREEKPFEDGIVTVQSKLYKKDECVEVNITMHV